MTRDRLTQAGAGVVIIGATVVCGNVLPRLAAISDAHVLRYTDVGVEGAPPIVEVDGHEEGAVTGADAVCHAADG